MRAPRGSKPQANGASSGSGTSRPPPSLPRAFPATALPSLPRGGSVYKPLLGLDFLFRVFVHSICFVFFLGGGGMVEPKKVQLMEVVTGKKIKLERD